MRCLTDISSDASNRKLPLPHESESGEALEMLLDLGNAFENGSQFALLLAMIITTNHMRLNFDNVYSTRSTDAWFRPVPSLIVVSC